MKLSIVPLVIAAALCACESGGPRKIAVGWPPGYAYVPDCKPLVKYQGTSIQVQGVTIPVPQLGGSAQVGGVSIKPEILNRAYQTTQILDATYRADCQLLPSYSSEKKNFERALRRMQASQTKLAQLALSLQGAQPTATPPAADSIPAQPASSAAVQSVASAAPEPARKNTIKQRLTKWVDSYSKKDKAAVVETPAKPNAALGLPPTEPKKEN